MKKLFVLTAALLVAISSMAQLDRSKMPEAGPAPEINIGDYTIFTLKNGMKVFVVQNDETPTVNFRLIVDRDPLVEGEKAGMTGIFGQLLRRGTTNRTKKELDEAIDFIGASLGTSSTAVYGSCISKYTEDLMSIMSDVVLNPAFPQEEFDKIKTETLSGLEVSENDPDAISGRVEGAVLYGLSHPYGEMMTRETIENITLEDCKNYYNQFFSPDITYLAIVGDIKKGTAKKLVKKYFGDWESIEVGTYSYETPENANSTRIAMVNRDESVQSIISISNLIDLKPGDPDVVKLSVTNQILGGGSAARLFRNLREDKAYTYGAYSDYNSDQLIGSFTASASVRNAVTDSAIAQFFYEFERIRTEPVSQEELDAAINYLIGSFARSLENANTVASFAINTARYNLPEDYYQTYLQRLSSVTIEDVLATAQKYILPENATVTIVGKYTDLSGKLDQFGEVEFYSKWGEPTEEPVIPIPDGMTAQDVVSGYIDAIGGMEKVAALEDMKVKYGMSIQGQTIEMEVLVKLPGKSFQSMKMGNMTLYSAVSDGKSAKVYQQGSEVPLGENEINEMIDGAVIVDEYHWLVDSANVKLTAVKRMDDGTKAYEITLEKDNGSVEYYYYDVESGLRIREVTMAETPQGEMAQSTSYSDYQEVNGVLFPFSVTLPLGPQSMKAEVKSLEINTGLSDSNFKL
jgi:predicted Zn-dependent peptidase/outer membrane lipoprotein-sorting protein